MSEEWVNKPASIYEVTSTAPVNNLTATMIDVTLAVKITLSCPATYDPNNAPNKPHSV